MKTNKYYYIFLCLLCYNMSFGQGWERIFNEGVEYRETNDVVEHPITGNFATIGMAQPADEDKDLALTIVNPTGITVLDTIYEKTGEQTGTSIIVNSLGNYIVAAYTNTGNTDFYFLEINPQGEIINENTHGNINDTHDKAYAIVPSLDGGYFVVGDSEGSELGIGYTNIWYTKLDSDLEPVWNHGISSFGGQRIKCRNATNTNDGGFVLVGDNFSTLGHDIFVLKILPDGSSEWDALFSGIAANQLATDVVQATDGNIVFGGYDTAGDSQVILRKLDISDGTIIWEKSFGIAGLLEEGWGLAHDSNGFAITGRKTSLSGDDDVFLIKTDSEGNLLWTKKYGGLGNDKGNALQYTSDGGYIIAGNTESYGSNEQSSYLIKTNGDGTSLTNLVHGNVFNDLNNNCSLQTNEDLLGAWIIRFTSNTDTHHAITDTNGAYEIMLGAGAYSIDLVLPGEYWEFNCVQNIVFIDEYDIAEVDIGANVLVSCPYMTVDIATPILRRGFVSIYTVSYCNQGTTIANPVSIEVQLDEHLTSISSDESYSDLGNNLISFDNIDDVAVGECRAFQFQATLSLNAWLGESHCVTAHIFPDGFCDISSDWDNSSIELEMECEGDSVRCKIKNVGTGNMLESKSFNVVEDHVMKIQDDFMLDSGEEIEHVLPQSTATYVMTAEQISNHPGFSMPSIVRECGEQGVSIFNQFNQDDGDAFISIDCRQNVGPFDPNEKYAFPKGITHTERECENVIEKNTEIEYMIRFQNVGTDVAFNVVVLDTLSEFLDVNTLRMGSASHSFVAEILEGHILKMSFHDIMLPDSTSNEAGSHGFFKFKIYQIENNMQLTKIENSAAIYFDFNEPIITNEIFHNVVEDLRYYYCLTPILPNSPSFRNASINPNPIFKNEEIKIYSQEDILLNVVLYDLVGREIYYVKVRTNESFNFNKKQIYSGTYFYHLKKEGRNYGFGKIVILGN